MRDSDIPVVDAPDYSDTPLYVQVIDLLSGFGWELSEEFSSFGVFHHPDAGPITIYVRYCDTDPIWQISSGGFDCSGSSLDRLEELIDEVFLNVSRRIILGGKWNLPSWLRR